MSRLAQTSIVRSMCLALIIGSPAAVADVVTDWNVLANEFVAAGKLPPAPAYRLLAIVQTAVLRAVEDSSSASVDAAVAAANGASLEALLPTQREAIQEAYQGALAAIPDGPHKAMGLVVGENAAAAVLAARAHDGFNAGETYRPNATPGAYVPTATPAASHWPGCKPWVMESADLFRPGGPPPLESSLWARDFNEIQVLGAKNSRRRTAEQTEIARFWEATGPAIYYPLVRAVATQPGRDVARNARLLAAAAQAMDDGLIAVYDAKYHYDFWRPVTAIRNADRDGNAATERDPGWLPLIDTPMHPEYPCAHCTLAGAVAAVISTEMGGTAIPKLSTVSATAPGAQRSWSALEDFVQEVSLARIYDGVHYRNSTEVGTALGQKVGRLVAEKVLKRAPD